MTAVPVVEAMLDEFGDPARAAAQRPIAAYWSGWSHPRVEFRAASAQPGSGGRVRALARRIIG